MAGNIWRGEIVNRRKDGALRTEEMTITPLHDERGDISHFIAVKQDITEQKSLESQFLQAQRMEAIGSLVGGMLKEKLPEEEDQEMLTMALSGARRGADIIKQLLTLSRGQGGNRAVLQPRHLIREIVQIMHETFPREIDLQQNVATQLWTVVADPTQLHQVLLNLCVNARDAMRGGGCLTVGGENVTLTTGELAMFPWT